MPRIKLEEKEKYEFEYKVILQVNDINYGGHLSNDALISLIHETRLNLLKDMGLKETDLGDGYTGMIMSDLGVNYKMEGFMFDEILIKSHIGEIKNNTFRIFHKLLKKDRIFALVETGFAAFDYKERKIVSIPGMFIEKINIYIDKIIGEV